MRRLPLACTFLVAVAAVVAASAGAAGPTGVRLVEAGGVKFPEKAFVLTLPRETRLITRDVQVFENGQPVFNPSVLPANAARKKQFGVVLAIDTSNSMTGPAIRNAMLAARAFAERRNPYQQLAVVSFDRRPEVLLPFTTSQAQIDNALAGIPALDEGTAIYDGVDLALRSLRRAGISSGSVVLLSDGADTSSYSTREGVIRRARAAHARVFTVGLRNRAFYPVALELLATQTGGLYTEAASAGALGAIYDRLGYQLANEYLVQYRSLAGPGVKTKVTVRVAGFPGTAVSAYETPELQVGEVPLTGFSRSLSDRALQSPVTMVLIALLVAGLFAGTAIVVLAPRRRGVRSRVAEFVSLSTATEEARPAAITDRLFEGTEKSLSRTEHWARFKDDLELADIAVPAVQVVLWTLVGTLGAFWLLPAIFDEAYFGLFALAVPLGVRAVVKRKIKRKRRAFSDQLPDNLEVIAAALRAGHTFVGALSVVVEDSPEPSRSEFRRVIADEQLGVPLEDALGVVVERMDSRDLDQVAVVAALQRQTGSNSAEVIDRVTETIRERAELRRLVRTLTAQGRLSLWVLSLLPLGLLLAITALNTEYIKPLFIESTGRVLLAVGSVMVIVGSLIIRKITDIKI